MTKEMEGALEDTLLFRGLAARPTRLLVNEDGDFFSVLGGEGGSVQHSGASQRGHPPPTERRRGESRGPTVRDAQIFTFCFVV